MTLRLRRRVGQAVRIGPDIVVVVESVNKCDVRLAIDAPGLRVDRIELLERKREGGTNAARDE